jgi:ABC-type lipoprotein export system ATPase subunit
MAGSQPTQDNGIAVRFHGVTKKYAPAKQQPRHSVGSIEVRRDELLMLVVPSVCGRTTLTHAAGVVSSPFRSCRASRSLQGVLSRPMDL